MAGCELRREDVRAIAWSAVHFIVASLFVLLMVSLVYADMRLFQNVKENGFVETAQITLLGISSILFWYISGVSLPNRVAIRCLSLFLVCMALREMDAWFDETFFHGSWKIAVIPVAIGCVIYGIRNLGDLVSGVTDFVRSKGYILLFVGMLCVLVFSRLVGSKTIWVFIFDDEILSRAVKNAVEESMELFGYILIFFSGIRYAVEVNTRAPCRIGRSAGSSGGSSAL